MTTLQDIIKGLLKSDAYPEEPVDIELIQTQMSLIFKTGEFVYKIKKPVNLGYLNYTTLENRKYYCQKEVELNRRLCPNVYLGVFSIVCSNNAIKIGTQGEILEYAVKMRTLPEEMMLNVLLSQGRATLEMIRNVAKVVAEFHAHAYSNTEISKFGELDAIKINTEENFNQTKKYIGKTITVAQYKSINNFTNDFMKNNVDLLRERVASQKIKDCHGDLHAAHICFNNGICIYDCIEFNDRFRYCDTASEIAFLAMDLDRYNRSDLSKIFVEAYIEYSNDKKVMDLMNFYKCYRAYVRGKVESFLIDDKFIDSVKKQKALSSAKKYFELAKSYSVNQ
jgi:uncharacterized protein